MIEVQGVRHNTVADAGKFFGVSTKAVNGWIRKGIISRPPTLEYGAGTIQVFPPDYLKRAKQELVAYRGRARQAENSKR